MNLISRTGGAGATAESTMMRKGKERNESDTWSENDTHRITEEILEIKTPSGGKRERERKSCGV